MDIISPLTSILCTLCNSVGKKLSHFINLDQQIHSLAEALKELQEKRDDLKREIGEAEFRGLASTNQVKGWLQRADAIEAEISSIVVDPGQRLKCFGCCNAKCSARYTLSRDVSKKLRDISELLSKGSFDVVVRDDKSLPAAVEEMPSRPTVGLDLLLQKIQQYLREDEVGIIGIYGMGGVGKTTLLKDINNKLLVETHNFDVVICVWSLKDSVLKKIQQAVAARFGLDLGETESIEQRASEIYRVVRGKKFLLLLDDVWKGFDLEKTGIPLPDKNNKCKVIFTTRSMDVCSEMDAHQKLKVDFLRESESWELFCQKIGRKEILDSPSVQSNAKTIVKKCGGLPLALITIARAMANKETAEEWKHALEVLDKTPSELRGMEDVFTLLKLSYDNLENDRLRWCFLYCSLFPENCSIDKDQLVEYWIAEGFLGKFHDCNVYNKGYFVIGSLKIACLLENGDNESTQVKMHDVVRTFALWMTSECGKNNERILIKPSAGLTEAPRVEMWERAERISLLDNEIDELRNIPACANLKALLLQWNSGLNKIPNDFFQFMPCLRVLDLSFTSLREIPKSIGKLIELRHLNLSGTKITTLPKELACLAKLRHLDLERTHFLKMIPCRSLCGLSQLTSLNLYYSYACWEVQEYENETAVGFSDLESLEYLTSLGITITYLTTLKRFSEFSKLVKCIEYLYIKECGGLFRIQLSTATNDGERLRRLSINNCCDFLCFIIDGWEGKIWLPKLEVLALHGLPKLTTVWSNPVHEGCLQNLRSINIWYCSKLRNVSWVFRLPKLEAIYLFYCEEIEEVVKGEDERVVEDALDMFPSLRILSMRDLPNLRSIFPSGLSFPVLERIAVIDCPNLKKLPFRVRAQTPVTYPTIYGSKEWWVRLEWDEAAAKSAFDPYFIET